MDIPISPTPALDAQGTDAPWTPMEVLQTCIAKGKTNLAGVLIPLVLNFIAMIGLYMAVVVIAEILLFVLLFAGAGLSNVNKGLGTAVALIGGLVMYCVMLTANISSYAWFGGAAASFALKAMRGEAYEQRHAFAGRPWFGLMLRTYLTQGLAYLICLVPVIVVVGAVLAATDFKSGATNQEHPIVLVLVFMVAAVLAYAICTYFYLGWFLAPSIISDGEKSVRVALKQSWNVTRAHRGKMLILSLMLVGIYFLGFLLCIGWLVVPALYRLVQAELYLRLDRSARNANLAKMVSMFGEDTST